MSWKEEVYIDREKQEDDGRIIAKKDTSADGIGSGGKPMACVLQQAAHVTESSKWYAITGIEKLSNKWQNINSKERIKKN